MKDTVSHYVPPHSPLTSTEPQVFSNNLTMPASITLNPARRPPPPPTSRGTVTLVSVGDLQGHTPNRHRSAGQPNIVAAEIPKTEPNTLKYPP
jgi:hypothetical protein